jgi:hypothetical protein
MTSPANPMQEAIERIPDAQTKPLYLKLLRGGASHQDHAGGYVWSPRASFALDLLGDGNTVPRGGYGMSFDRIEGNYSFSDINNTPFVQDTTV